MAEDVVVVVAAHCHVSLHDETSDRENQFHGQSQGFRQLAMFVEVQRVETEHLETQRDELPLEVTVVTPVGVVICVVSGLKKG